MGKIVNAEKCLFDYLENLSTSISPSKNYSVGLILGQSTGDNYYVIHLSRTPPPASKDVIEETPISSSAISKNIHKSNMKLINSIDEIPNNWIADHAKCVTRMLPGGMFVLGLFIIGPDDTINTNDSLKKLKSIIMMMKKNFKSNPHLYGDSLNDYLILTFDYSSKRFSCKSCDINNDKPMKNIEWKFLENMTTWFELETRVNFNQLLFPITNMEVKSETLKQRLEKIIDSTFDKIQSAIVLIEGKNVPLNECIKKIASEKKDDQKESKDSSNLDSEILQADIYIPYHSSGKDLHMKTENCNSLIHLMGQMISKIFVNEKSTIKEAVNAIKQDIIRSMTSRLEMHWDSLIEEENDLPEDNITLHEPPRRVLVPLPQNKITLSDYLFPGEGPQEALASLEELLDLKVNENNVLIDYEVQVDPLEFYNDDKIKNNDNKDINILNNNYSLLYISGLGLIIAFIVFIIAILMY